MGADSWLQKRRALAHRRNRCGAPLSVPWFGAFEPLLDGMGASYYPGGHAAALHTDLCSPVATDPTWSRLEPSFQRRFIADGQPLWHDPGAYAEDMPAVVDGPRLHLRVDRCQSV